MSLAAGARLGAYEIVSHIGIGGMGDVYRARDMKLVRDIALKTLPDTCTTDMRRTDVALDGRVIAIVPLARMQAGSSATEAPLQVVLKWFEELEARVPAK